MEAVASKPIKRSKVLEPDIETIIQPSDVNLELPSQPFERPKPVKVDSEGRLFASYEEELAFNELPVKIFVNPSDNPEAALHVPAWVNGKGIERWLEGIGWVEVRDIPVGVPVTIKRKYVENLLRSKTMGVHTPLEVADGKEPTNPLRRTFSRTFSITREEDAHPLGAEWYRRLLRSIA